MHSKKNIQTKNLIINALLNTKITSYPDIDFNTTLNIDRFDFDPRYITVLLGNALDNAIEAVSRLPLDKQRIIIAISENESVGKIVIKNPYLGDIKVIEEEILSNKRDHESGIGFQSMRSILKEYKGLMEYSCCDQEFRIVFILKKS